MIEVFVVNYIYRSNAKSYLGINDSYRADCFQGVTTKEEGKGQTHAFQLSGYPMTKSSLSCTPEVLKGAGSEL